jgi:arsenite methyltransferase
MVAFAARGAREARIDHAGFVLGCAERLPIPDAWADLVISDGALNLAISKTAAFAEIFRVLRPGGRFQAADLLLTGSLPEDLRKDEFAWSD